MKLNIIILTAINALLFAQPETVQLSDIHKTMHQLFSYHVENKSFTKTIAERSIKIYIEQFDPDKMYLLQTEVAPFLHLKEYEKQAVVDAYQRGDYRVFLELRRLEAQAIHRHQALRERVWTRLRAGETSLLLETSGGYARDLADLEDRFFQKIQGLMVAYEQRLGVPLSEKMKSKLIKRIEKRLTLREAAYLDPQDEALAIHVLKAMARSLDAHTAYYTPKEATELRTSLKKEFRGIGIVLKETEQGVVIADLIHGGPAHRSGKVQVGDKLLTVNGFDIEELTFEEVLELLKTPERETVTLGLYGQKAYQLALRQEVIILNEERLSYTYEPYQDGVIAKIDLPGFYDNGGTVTAECDLKKAIQALQSIGPIYGMVIDLRENPGGFLTQAVKVSGMFVSQGIIVISKYSDGQVRYLKDTNNRSFYQGPLILLTSKASASAAEILAQSLQDYGVALVVGDPVTYGKGSMQYQTVTEEGADCYFRVTVGRYYTISGRSPQIEGVKADIVVPSAFAPYDIGERYLEYPLASDDLNLEGLVKTSDEYARAFGPYLQMRTTYWTHLLPQLRKKSEQRLAKSRDFQAYLRQLYKDPDGCQRGTDQEDFQMQESVAIIKDMIELSHSIHK